MSTRISTACGMKATLDGPRRSLELARARALRPLYESADLLLDIHSMQHATRR